MIEITISQTSGTILSSDLRIQIMISCYLFIDIIQLTLIFKNEFWAVNIFKLINDHILNSINKQDLQLSRINELWAHDDDVTQQNLKNMIFFLRCLEVYDQCLIKMINDQLRHSLQVWWSSLSDEQTRSIRMVWQCDILSRHRMSIYYGRANY